MLTTSESYGHAAGGRPQARIAGVAYELGEQERPLERLPDWTQRSQAFPKGADPAMWGWGTYRRTSRTGAELAIAAAQRTLTRAGLCPGDVDTVVLCSVSFASGAPRQLEFVNVVLGELGLLHTFYVGMTLGRCSTMVAAIRAAEAFVASGRSHTVLVIATDVVEDDAQRLQAFGVFSDAASSCLVTAGAGQYTIVRAACAADRATMDDTGARLAAACNEQLFAGEVPDRCQISRVFVDNLFRPLVCMREQLAGFTKAQLYVENIARLGHCSASDPLINLEDCTRAEGLAEGAHVVLAAGTPGLRNALLLRADAALAAR